MEEIIDIENWLILNYKNYKKKDIVKILNISESRLKSFAKKLKLTDPIRAKRIADRNKKLGRDLNFDKLKEIALLYKTRGQFQLMDSSAYATARRSGVLNDICSHMINASYSIPQMILSYILRKIIGDHIYNDRSIIKPYEIDIYYPEYKLGFEYDGLGWHLNKNDDKKNKLIEDGGIKIIKIIENNRRYEEDIKEQLISHIDEINKILDISIISEDIQNINIDYMSLFKDIIDDETLNEIISKYTIYSDFRKNNINLYTKLSRLNMLSKINLPKEKVIWTEELIKSEVNKYISLKDFIENSGPCYLHIKRNNLEYLIESLDRKKYYTLDECLYELKENLYKTKYQLRKNNPRLYDRLKRKIGLSRLGELLLEFYPKAD